MGFVDDAERVHIETVDEWWRWLAQHHASSPGVFVVSWRSPTGRPAAAYDTLVEYALCFGWIDGRAQGLDDERSMQWFTRRKPRSGWARPNKERIERLTAAGLLQPAGIAMIEAAKADGSWTLLDSVERLEVPPDLAAALETRPGAREYWDGLPRTPRREMLQWLAFARTAPTRDRRVTEIADAAARGERARG